MQRRLWMLPLIMLALAALACDGEMLAPPQAFFVREVSADQEQVGRAFAFVIDDTSENAPETHLFVTDDYGENWAFWDGILPETNAPSLPLQINGTSLMLGNEQLWLFPSFERLSFFNRGYPRLDLHYEYRPFRMVSQPSNALQGDTLYVALGTEGVLVGPAPNTESTREWRITNNGIEPLVPLRLTYNLQDSLNKILWNIFLLPPIPLFHAYALVRIWSYIMPIKIAWKRAILVSLGLTLISSVGAIIFFTQIPVKLDQVVWICTAIIVVVSVAFTWYFTKSLKIKPAKRWLYLLTAFVLSLLAPSQYFFTSWLPTLLVLAYFTSSFIVRWYFGAKAILTLPLKNDIRWEVDRLSLESIVIAIGVTFLSATVGVRFIEALAATRELTIQFIALLVLGTIIFIAWLIDKRFKYVARYLGLSNPNEPQVATWQPFNGSIFFWVLSIIIMFISFLLSFLILNNL